MAFGSGRRFAIVVIGVAAPAIVALIIADRMSRRSILSIGALAVVVIVAGETIITLCVTYRMSRRRCVRPGRILSGRPRPKARLHTERRENEKRSKQRKLEHYKYLFSHDTCRYGAKAKCRALHFRPWSAPKHRIYRMLYRNGNERRKNLLCKTDAKEILRCS